MCEDPTIVCPYPYDQASAQTWLDHLTVVRHAAAIRRELYRQITIPCDADGSSWVYDSGVFYAKLASGYRQALRARLHQSRRPDRDSLFNLDNGAEGVVPAFLGSVANAMLAWPNDIRPARRTGTPIECCNAALTAIRERLPRIEHRRQQADASR